MRAFKMLLLTDYENKTNEYRGGSRISGKGVLIYENVEVHFADSISFLLNIL